ncbi:MAG: putative lipid II flippase FtsW [Thermodesulfobacteriota bacterium]
MIKDRDIIDKTVFITVMALTVVGIAMIYSTSYIMALNKINFNNDGYFFLKKQSVFLFAGIIGILVTMRIPYTIYKKPAPFLLLISFILLSMVFIPGLGIEAGGSRRWLKLGFFTFQPSEVGKLALIIYLASLLSKKGENIKDFVHGFFPPVAVGIIMIVLLVREPDFGTALSVGTIILLMMFVAGVKFRYLVSLGVLSLPIIYFMVIKVEYRLERLLSFMDPWKDPHGTGYQIIQSAVAFGSGGVWGVGLGDGRQKLFYLPEAHTDFILSVVGEELGLIGVSLIILLYLILVVGGIVIAVRTSDPFGALLAFGITTLIGLQAVLNMGVVTGLLPTKGLTLPFISYGGTSLLMNMVGVGILLSVSMTGRKE